MRRHLLLFAMLVSVFSSFAFTKDVAPWNAVLKKQCSTKVSRIPAISFWTCTYIPQEETGTSYAGLAIRLATQGVTGNYWSRARIRIYCYYWHPTFPTGYYGWDYKVWQVEVPPNSTIGDTYWELSGGETFNTYIDGEGNMAISEGDESLVSWVQE